MCVATETACPCQTILFHIPCMCTHTVMLWGSLLHLSAPCPRIPRQAFNSRMRKEREAVGKTSTHRLNSRSIHGPCCAGIRRHPTVARDICGSRSQPSHCSTKFPCKCWLHASLRRSHKMFHSLPQMRKSHKLQETGRVCERILKKRAEEHFATKLERQTTLQLCWGCVQHVLHHQAAGFVLSSPSIAAAACASFRADAADPHAAFVSFSR